MFKSIVIGGGFGGIASALRLRALGHEVDLYDQCSRLGGRAQVFERNGFRFDAGPTVITAPFLFDELFTLFGKDRRDYIDFIPLDTWYRFHFHDGETFDYGPDLESTWREVERLSPGDGPRYEELLDVSKKIFDLGFTKLADVPFDRFSLMLRQVPDLLRLGSHRSVASLVKSYLRDPRLQNAFSIHPLLVGGNPFDTTCIYSLIHFLEMKWGIHFARGGTGALVDALAQLMEEEGIRVFNQSPVSRIVVENGEAKGIALPNGDIRHADAVVSNVDPLHLYRSMLGRDEISLPAKIKSSRASLSMGLFVLFFGSRRKYPKIAHHTIWLGERFKDLLRDIFRGKSLPPDFSLYLHRPTATDESFAPEGCDSFYVLAPVPNLQADIDWEQEGPLLADRILEALDDSILPGIRENAVDPFFMTPEDFKRDYSSVDGAGFSVAPVFRQSAWFRFHNRAEGVRNLYLCGAGTHPGAGVPGVLSSGKIVEKLVRADHPILKRSEVCLPV